MNIPAGTYTVTVSAGGSCTNSASFTVANNTPTPNLTVTPTASTCGLNNGAVDLSVSPAGTYTFIWSNGATAEDLSGVAAGAYSVTVTATASGCTATAAATVTNNNPAINISGNAGPVTSCTTPNGSINITATPLNTYTYTWTNGAPTEDLVNIPAGTYTVTVSVGGSCTNSASFTVANNTATPNLTATPTASTCGLNNGAVDLSISPAGAYTFIWSNGATAEDLSGVAAGAYSVTVTATASSCTATIAATVTNNNPAINISGNAGPVTSCTTPNGSINITATPLNTYTYTWTNGAPTEDLVNIPAGTYTVTVSAGVSCTNSASFTVMDNTFNPVLTETITPAVCGDPNGAIELNVSPSGGYDFIWSNGVTSQNLTGIASGNYGVTVTGSNGCTAFGNYNVPNNSTSFSIAGVATPVTTCGTPNGEVDLTVSPSGTYDFLWSNGATTEDLTDLAAGTHSVTVTQAGSCSGEAVFTVTNETVIHSISQNIAPATCGQNNGSVDLTITPVAVYGFLWSNGETTQNLTNIGGGTYQVTVTSTASGCSATASATVADNTFIPNITGSATPVTSCLAANGSVIIDVSPSGSYNVNWSNGDTLQNISGLAPGTFSVTVSAGVNCVNSASFMVTDSTFSPVLTEMITPADCGGSNGVIELNISPSGSYDFLWSNGDTLQNLTGIASGSYGVTVTASNGCTVLDAFDVMNNNIAFSLSATPANNTSCVSPNGAIDLTVFPSGAYVFLWSNGATAEDLQNIASGSYSVTVTDAGGCLDVQTFSVGGPTLPVVFITGPASACEGETATLSATAGFNTYIWTNGETTSSITTSQTGTYSVMVTDNNGCTATASQDLQSLPLPTPAINGPSVICGGSTVFSVIGGVFTQILWSTGEMTPVVTVSQPAVYSVTVTDANGCTAYASQPLTVWPDLTPIITVTLTSCDSTATLNVGGGFAEYLWSNGSTAPAITVSSDGIYSVTVSDANGCTDMASENVVLPNPPTVQVVGAASLCQGDQTVLAVPGNFSQYLWSTGETTPQIAISQGGLYAVTVSDANGCMAFADWTVAELPTSFIMLETSACSPQDTGTVQVVFTNQFGCDSVVVTVISLAPPILPKYN
ncbi:MAG: hypothetical protein IPN33_09390 [Saprospiraceae bacterium]|nr:hypothetical protein [Saprospiraceae bacterium]